jgi:5S rRNA maturation endonuclease (ribonuclease M5)
MVAEDAAICMRVQSSKQHVFKNNAVGWYHWLKDPLPEFTPKPKQDVPTISVRDLITDWMGDLHGPTLEHLAISLGVTYSSLRLLGAIWARKHNAWAFPMRGGDGEYKGIRLRADDGRKWAVTGSKEGVFYAFGIPNVTDTLYVVEGPTDTAAGMSIGLDVCGRPSCYGGIDEIRVIVRNQKYKRVVVVSDSDDVGRRGAKTLIDALWVPRCILTLPTKDLREFVKEGGNTSTLSYLLHGIPWTINPTRKETT